MRWSLLLIALTLLSGCATFKYTSNRSALDVSECITRGWKKAPKSGFEAPVSLTKFDEYYFVGVELHAFYQLPTGMKHPSYAVWAEVRESRAGSVTEYHRAYQFTHKTIDRVVKECQDYDHNSFPLLDTVRVAMLGSRWFLVAA